MMLKFSYQLTDAARNREFVETGHRSPSDNTAEFDSELFTADDRSDLT